MIAVVDYCKGNLRSVERGLITRAEMRALPMIQT